MTSRSWSIGSSRSRARRATLLPLLEAERRRSRGAAVPRFALTVCCGFAGLRLVERRRLTLSPPWASPPRADDLILAQQQLGCAARQNNARRSELGHSRRFDDVRVTSAFPPIATKERTSRDVSKVPNSDIAPNCSSFLNLFRQPLICRGLFIRWAVRRQDRPLVTFKSCV